MENSLDQVWWVS